MLSYVWTSFCYSKRSVQESAGAAHCRGSTKQDNPISVEMGCYCQQERGVSPAVNVCWISVLDYDVWWSNWREERLPSPTSRRTWSMRRPCSNLFTSRKQGKKTEAPLVETTIDRLHSLATMEPGSQKEWMRIINGAINQSCSPEFHSNQCASAWWQKIHPSGQIIEDIDKAQRQRESVIICTVHNVLVLHTCFPITTCCA